MQVATSGSARLVTANPSIGVIRRDQSAGHEGADAPGSGLY
jgi:hypothetical protein